MDMNNKLCSHELCSHAQLCWAMPGELQGCCAFVKMVMQSKVLSFYLHSFSSSPEPKIGISTLPHGGAVKLRKF